MKDETWRKSAACRGLPNTIFFPMGAALPATTKALCESCVVNPECLEYALALPKDEDRCGIFAGTSANQRSKIRALRAAGLRQDSVQHSEPTHLVWDARIEKYRAVVKQLQR